MPGEPGLMRLTRGSTPFSCNLYGSPEKLIVDLPGANQMFQLFETCISAKCKNIVRHANTLKHCMELESTHGGIAAALKPRKLSMNLVKRDTIARIITIVRPQSYRTPGECLRDNLRNFADPIIFLRTAHIENLVVHHLPGSFKDCDNSLADVQHMHQRAPRGAIARHLDLPRCPGQPSKVI